MTTPKRRAIKDNKRINKAQRQAKARVLLKRRARRNKG